MSLLAGALFGCFRLLRVSPRLAAAFAAVLVTLYAALAGGTASVVRAAVMADIYLLAVVLDRRADLLNTLALAVLALLAWNPRVVADVGFQLTVLATLGIVLVLPACEGTLGRVPRILRWVLESGTITLAATLMTLPVLAGSFNRVSPVGVLANIPIVPLAGLITALGTATCGFLLLPLPAGWLVQLDGWLVELLLALATWFAGWPWSTLEVYTPTPGMYGAYYAAVAAAVAAFGASRRTWRAAGAAIAAASAGLLVVLVLARLHPGDDPDRARVTMLDVGQGQAVFVELPGRRRILVDVGNLAGDGLDVGKHVVAPFLRHEWVGRLDVLALSHPEADHMSGAPAILRSFVVGEVWSAAPLGSSPTGLWVEEYLREHRIPHRILSAALPPVEWGAGGFEVLYPSASGDVGVGREPASLVLALRFGGRTALLTGDVTARRGEPEVVARALRAEVITAPHHGSRTSSSEEFLEAVRPSVALVSAGYRNRFRHPHPDIVARYARRGIRILRTDLHGALTVEVGRDGIRAWGRRE